MDQGSSCNSWLTRTKFSHTVWHRLDCSGTPISLESLRSSRFPTRPSDDPRDASGPGPGPVVFRPPSPPPSRLEDPRAPFREARSEARRFSSPGPRRAGTDAGLRQRLVHDADPPEADARKETAWSLCAGGGRVNAVQMPEDQELDLSQLYIGTKFATGAHSRLYHGVYRDETVAVKLITQPDNGDNDLLPAQLEREFRREVAFLSRLCHRNILKLIGSSSSPPVFIIVTEYLSGGCLRAFLHRLEKRSLELKQLISIALDIARGMEYIHSQGIFHCDLKPENILFDGELCVKIADFGIACEEGRNDTLAGDPGTFRWMAPERIKGKKYGRKVDVYSFGLILWEMLTGNIPYGDMTPMQAAFSAVNKDLRPTIPPDCPPPLCALIEQCWASHPDKRPEFWQIVKVLEQFDLALARDGTLDQVQNLTFQEQKNRLLHWIQKLKKPTYRGGLGQPVSKLL